MPPPIQNVIPTVIPLLPAHPLSIDDQRSLRCLVARMIPASAQYSVPGADDETIFADILASLRPHANLARDAMAQLQSLSGACFADLDTAQQSAVAQRFRSERRALATLLVSVTVLLAANWKSIVLSGSKLAWLMAQRRVPLLVPVLVLVSAVELTI